MGGRVFALAAMLLIAAGLCWPGAGARLRAEEKPVPDFKLIAGVPVLIGVEDDGDVQTWLVATERGDVWVQMNDYVTGESINTLLTDIGVDDRPSFTVPAAASPAYRPHAALPTVIYGYDGSVYQFPPMATPPVPEKGESNDGFAGFHDTTDNYNVWVPMGIVQSTLETTYPGLFPVPLDQIPKRGSPALTDKDYPRIVIDGGRGVQIIGKFKGIVRKGNGEIIDVEVTHSDVPPPKPVIPPNFVSPSNVNTANGRVKRTVIADGTIIDRNPNTNVIIQWNPDCSVVRSVPKAGLLPDHNTTTWILDPANPGKYVVVSFRRF